MMTGDVTNTKERRRLRPTTGEYLHRMNVLNAEIQRQREQITNADWLCGLIAPIAFVIGAAVGMAVGSGL